MMGGCTIISDSNVHEILISQTLDETLAFMHDISRCLTDYSLSKEREYQPAPGVVVRPNGQKALFRSFTSPSNVGCKIIVDPAPDHHGRKAPLHGTLVITDDTGSRTGVINAAEVTAYRTSLASMIPFMSRERVKKVVVFGAGKQALWHARLALVLRGSEIEQMTIVNRSRERGEHLLNKLKADNERRWKTDVHFTGLYAADSQYDKLLERALSDADVVFCTVPSTQPLFPARYIPNQTQPLITAIGSWQPNMIELDPELIKHIVGDQTGPRVLLVDDRDSCLDHAGEVVQSQLEEDHLVEIGAIVGTRSGESSSSAPVVSEEFEHWLRSGLVIYKSVGVSVMDLTAGQRLLTLAREKGLGTTLTDF